mmetsp:Transcript_100352/g.272865  ORF Transcript_100352/g.272865 Transcript_100352/m.272865 type:complete len:236 (-) Transcript_100352:65-772(-)
MRGSYCCSSQLPLLRPPMKDSSTTPPPWSAKLISVEILFSSGVQGASTKATSIWSMLMMLESVVPRGPAIEDGDLAKMFSRIARPPKNSISSATRVAAVMFLSTSWSFLASVSTEYMTAQTISLNGLRGLAGPTGQPSGADWVADLRWRTFAHISAIFGTASTWAALTTQLLDRAPKRTACHTWATSAARPCASMCPTSSRTRSKTSFSCITLRSSRFKICTSWHVGIRCRSSGG